MRRSDYLILIGSILVAIGIVLQITLLGNGEGSFFFVFPFVFVGTGALGALMSLIVVVAMLVIGFRFCVFNSESVAPTYLRTRDFCKICGKPIPEESRFCPYCGTPAGHQYDQSKEQAQGESSR